MSIIYCFPERTENDSTEKTSALQWQGSDQKWTLVEPTFVIQGSFSIWIWKTKQCIARAVLKRAHSYMSARGLPDFQTCPAQLSKMSQPKARLMAISHTVLSESLIMNVPIYWNLLCQTLRKDYVDYLAQCCYLSSLQFDLDSNVRLRVAKVVKCQCSKIEIRGSQ